MRRGFGRWIVGLFVLGIGGLVGCPSNQTATISHKTLPFRGQELELIVPDSFHLPAHWEVLVQEWSAQTGATAKFTEYDAGRPLPSPSLKTSSMGGGFLLFPLRQLCELDMHLARLPSTSGEFDSRDVFKGLRERVLSRDKKLIASPVSVPVLACYYRADLLRAARLKPPETWEDYQKLVDSLESWAPGLTAVEPLSADFRSTLFFARSLAFCKHPENYSVWFDIDTAKPMMTSPGFFRAMETAERTWRKLPAEVASYNPADCRRQLLGGKAAIALSFEPRSAEINVPESRRVEGIEIGVCRMPGSRSVYNRNSKKWDTLPDKGVNAPALCGFAGLAAAVVLPAKHLEEPAAFNFLGSVCSTSQFEQAFATIPKGPVRESQSATAPAWFGPELSTAEADQYCDAVAQSLRDPQVVFELPVAGAEEFRTAGSNCLGTLLKGEASVEQCLNAMQQAFEAIVERHGADVMRDSHRRGLGMPPAMKR